MQITKYQLCLGLLLTLMLSVNSPNISAHGDKQKHHSNALFSGIDSGAGRAVKQFHHALQNGDEKLARRLLADDVLIFEGGGIERSADGYASHHMKADIKFLKELKIKTLEHQVKIAGEMAYSSARTSMKGEYNGKKIDITSMESIVLKKVNGSWLITHIHWSN